MAIARLLFRTGEFNSAAPAERRTHVHTKEKDLNTTLRICADS